MIGALTKCVCVSVNVRARGMLLRLCIYCFSLFSMAFSGLHFYTGTGEFVMLYKQYLHINVHPLSMAWICKCIAWCCVFFLFQMCFFFVSLVFSFSLFHSPKGIHHTLNWYFIRWTIGWSVVHRRYSKYRDEDTVYDVLRTTRQVDSLLLFFFSVYLFSLDLLFIFRWCCCCAAQRSIAQHRITMNQARIELRLATGDFSWKKNNTKKKYVINHAQLRLENVRNIRFPISRINEVIRCLRENKYFSAMILCLNEFYSPQEDYFLLLGMFLNCNEYKCTFFSLSQKGRCDSKARISLKLMWSFSWTSSGFFALKMRSMNEWNP